jgi:hypothetical protein
MVERFEITVVAALIMKDAHDDSLAKVAVGRLGELRCLRTTTAT